MKLTQRHIQSERHVQHELSQVMFELDMLRKESERLQRVNALHARLAGILDFTSMLEAFSVWLMPYVCHDLISYNNFAHNKKHFTCSCHGPKRRKVIALAEDLLNDSSLGGAVVFRDGQYAHRWSFESFENAGILLLLKEDQKLNDGELDLINSSLEILLESLHRGLEYEEVFEQVRTDPLTGLGNRRTFDDRIAVMMDGARRYNRPLTMISIDLDYFKEVNDNLGHLTGDAVLCDVAEVFSESVRASDLVVRMGGDEFLIVLDDTDLNSAHMLGERLCQAVNDLAIHVDGELRVGISAGLTELQKDEELAQWLERTDDILYKAKASGRGRICS